MAVYARSEDLLRMGAYAAGTDAELDAAVPMMPALKAFFRQSSTEKAALPETVRRLRELVS